MDASEVTERLRCEIGMNNMTPIVATSTNEEEDAKLRAVGVTECLQQPLHPSYILRALSTWFGSSRVTSHVDSPAHEAQSKYVFMV